MTTNPFRAELKATSECADAAQYFAMAWAAGSQMWSNHGKEAFLRAAHALGYTLVPSGPRIVDRPDDHEPVSAYGAWDDAPLTFATSDDGRR